MPSLPDMLQAINETRARDPLAPVTVIVPSHVAGLQLRRRLAVIGPFAAVRFETMARIAEVMGAARLAAGGRSPLARPIGDYVAHEVGHEASGEFARVAELPGFGRALRVVFRRLKRGGVTAAAQAPDAGDGKLREILRLYALFQARTAAFYDEEDLLYAAATAVNDGSAGALADLGAIYVLPPGAESAGAANLLNALERRLASYTVVNEAAAGSSVRMVLAPDPATEAHEVAREITDALRDGVAIDEIAVFHGADQSYPRLLREALARAGIPAAPMPGVPLIETAAGRGVLGLASLPETDFARAAVMDFLSVAPIRGQLPAGTDTVPALVSAWDRLSRAAGVTHGLARWRLGLSTLISDREADIQDMDPAEEARRETRAAEIGRARDLLSFIGHLGGLLEALGPAQPAPAFIAAFKDIVRSYLRGDAAALDKVEAEIDQLGTVGAIGGVFSLESFTRALRANLETAVDRDRAFGDGVLIADYRLAAGLEFRHVIISGAHDGAFPAGPGAETLVTDAAWRQLKEHFPFIEDTDLRLERAKAAAERAPAAATGTLTWSAALNQANGGGELYPAAPMVAAARRLDPLIANATALRVAGNRPWLRRARSPLGSLIAGTLVEVTDVSLRAAVIQKRSGSDVPPDHPLAPALSMLRARRGTAFSEWDGNLAALEDDAWLELTRAVSPTALEHYAACGFRYFGRSLLRLNVVEETEERETMDPAERGTLIHDVLHRFFREKQAEGRPGVNEAWTAADTSRLLEILDDHLGAARARGRTGLDLYASYEARNIRADLVAFLEADTAFRRETGAIPTGFEVKIPEIEIAGMRLHGYADRIDETPDGHATWVIDYKTGSASPYDGMTDDDPLMGGTKLQLPVYLSATAPRPERKGLYWLISRRAGFVQKAYEPTAHNQALFAATMEAILAGIRGGAFPAVSGEENEVFGGFTNCRFCDFTRLCSRRRDYEIAAKLDDPGLRPWRAVAMRARGEKPA